MWECNYSHAGDDIGFTDDELGNAVENEATVASVPVISLCREVGGNTLQVELLSRVDVVYTSSERSRHTLLSFFDLTRKDGVDPSVYANGAVLALIVADDGLHNSGVRRDKSVEGLRAAFGRHIDLVNYIRHAGTPLC